MAITRTFARSVAAAVLAVAAFVALPAVQAAAAIVPVSSRAELNGNLNFSWDIFGPEGSFTDSPGMRDVGPITVFAASSTSSGLRRADADGSLGFRVGEPLLRDDFNTVESFIVGFNPPFVPLPSDSVVRGFGFELQATRSFMPEFTVLIEIFDSNFNSTFFSVDGNRNGAPVFVGALSDTVDIRSISLLIDNVNAPGIPGGPGRPGGSLAINSVDVVVVDQGVTSVPVPATWALLLAPLAGFAFAARRRRS